MQTKSKAKSDMTWRRWVAIFSATCLGIYFLASFWVYTENFPLPHLRSNLLAVLEAIFFLLASLSVGHQVLYFLKFIPIEKGRGNTIFGMTSTMALGVGLISLGIVSTHLVWGKSIQGVLITITFLLGLSALQFVLSRQYRNYLPTLNFSSLTWAQVSLVTLAFIGIVLSFLSVFAPITYYDSLVYHLALPELYLRVGTLNNPSHNLYSFFPQNMEMIFMLILNRFPNPECVINLILWLFSLLISLCIAEWLATEGHRTASLFSFALWWTMPATLFLSVGAYVEIPLTLYIFLAVQHFFISRKSDISLWNLTLSGIFCGLAFGTKYTGGATFIILFFMLLIMGSTSIKDKIKKLIYFSISFVLASSPWLIKNYLSIKNPVFPFLYQYIDCSSVGWSSESAASYFSMLTEYGAKSHVFLELLTAPWRIINSSLTFGGGFDVLGDFGWYPMLIGLPLYVLVEKRDKMQWWLLAFTVTYFCFWFISKPVLRFLIPCLPFFIYFASKSIPNLLQCGPTFLKPFIFLSLIYYITSNLYIYSNVQLDFDAYEVPLGREEKLEFLTRKLDYYPAFQYLNDNSIKTASTLLIGEQRTYHLKIPFVSSNLFARSVISEHANNAEKSGTINEFIQENQIKMILVNEKELLRLGGLKQFGFSAEGEEKLRHFLTNFAQVVYDNRGVKIFKLS